MWLSYVFKVLNWGLIEVILEDWCHHHLLPTHLLLWSCSLSSISFVDFGTRFLFDVLLDTGRGLSRFFVFLLGNDWSGILFPVPGFGTSCMFVCLVFVLKRKKKWLKLVQNGLPNQMLNLFHRLYIVQGFIVENMNKYSLTLKIGSSNGWSWSVAD